MADVPQLFRDAPLLAFSIYTQSQAIYLARLGERLGRRLDTYEEEVADFDETYHQFWLWLLGAYEVLRTLDQGKAGFSGDFQERVHILKAKLAKVRMPFAKQELKRRGSQKRGTPVQSELSVFEVARDMTFLIDGDSVSAQALLKEYATFFASVRPEEIAPGGA